MSSDVLKQCHPVVPMTGADPAPVPVPPRLAALATAYPPPVQLRANAPCALLRTLRYHSFRWSTRPAVPADAIDTIERLLRVHRIYRGVQVRAFRICGGQPTECGDALAAAPVEMLEVRLYV